MALTRAQFRERRDKLIMKLPIYYGVILKGKYPRLDMQEVYNLVHKRKNCEKTLVLMEGEFPDR